MLRRFFREPIPEIEEAADLLAQAVAAHEQADRHRASDMLRAADMKPVWDWLDSVWGKASPYTMYRPVAGAPPTVPKELRSQPRYATPATRAEIH